MRIAREDNNDPSDGMEVDTRGSERTDASVCVSASGYEGGYCKARNTNR